MIINILACATCSANSQGDNNAAGWAIFFMLGVVVPVISTLTFFLIRMARRESAHLDADLVDEFELPAASR